MIKTLVAHTTEIDDLELAVSEVLAQLGSTFLNNSVGIIACHYEFVYSGVVKALSEALTFPITGTITPEGAVPDEAGSLLLTLMVLTSDEAVFVTKLTDPLDTDVSGRITQAFGEAAGDRGNPALILAFAPYMLQNSGDEYVNIFSSISDTPVFGTLAVDDTNDFSNCFLVYNGVEYRDRLAMILIYGAIKPRFHIATISRSKMLDKEALITKSEGHVLMEVNDRPVIEYFDDLGLTQAAETQYAMTSLPFLIDYNDNTPPVSKVFIMLTPERYAICAGAMPVGSTMYIGVFDKEDVVYTTGNTLDEALGDTAGASCMLVYSCISRSMTLGGDHEAEISLVRAKTTGHLPFLMAYSGGEICPTQVKDGKAINRFHNNAFICCVF